MTTSKVLNNQRGAPAGYAAKQAMKVAVIGTGYVGLVTGACLAKRGHQLVLVDIDAAKIAAINRGVVPIAEPYLSEMLRVNHLTASTDPAKMRDCEVFFICVGTPLGEDGVASLAQVTAAAEQVSRLLRKTDGYCVVTVKSTVPPGTTEGVVIPILEKSGRRVGVDFGVCMSPEFLRAGRAVADFMNPERIVIGEYDARSGEVLARLFRPFKSPVLRTTLSTAEMIKLASNAFLASRVSLMNELGNICKQLGLDAYQVAQGIGYDGRIGDKFLNAGIGFGGSCLPKDLTMLINAAREAGYTPEVLTAVRSLNDRQATKMLVLLKKHIVLEGAKVGILGLAFKPNTDDVRGSRAGPVVEALLKEGAVVRAYDPVANENFRALYPQIEYTSPQGVLDCDAVLIITEWEEFNSLDYRGRLVIDGRRIPKAREARIYEGVCW